MKKYTTSLDTISKYVPWFIIVFIILVVAKNTFLLTDADMRIPAVLVLLLLPAIVLMMYLIKPTSIIIDEQAITIERKLGPLIIPFSEIMSVQRPDNMRYTIRLFGNGGIFGYTGIFYKRGIGIMHWHCTQRKNYVLITKTGGKKILITPDEPDELIEDIEEKAPLLVIA